MNHTYEIDWLFGWIFCEKMGVLGNCKAYAKKVIQYIPAIGWCWKFAEFAFLERSFEKDKIIIDRQVNEIFDYPDPCWVSLVVIHSHMHLVFIPVYIIHSYFWTQREHDLQKKSKKRVMRFVGNAEFLC